MKHFDNCPTLKHFCSCPTHFCHIPYLTHRYPNILKKNQHKLNETFILFTFHLHSSGICHWYTSMYFTLHQNKEQNRHKIIKRFAYYQLRCTVYLQKNWYRTKKPLKRESMTQVLWSTYKSTDIGGGDAKALIRKINLKKIFLLLKIILQGNLQ